MCVLLSLGNGFVIEPKVLLLLERHAFVAGVTLLEFERDYPAELIDFIELHWGI